ncbi:hypothetical protein PROFUN_02307 [Planoprotostelium fungivorum]|uniref:SEC7 domain-containing protein n=1 Tax=Planoprotostelium fungivorum TaxID=1890364 RepID=A0A2P6NYK8_9EUKA|nr:hypothetical protein PROFUN_02307 [Planoprotostelium fungivorum]
MVLGLTELPIEIIVRILTFLSVRDVSAVLQTCAHLRSVCISDALWTELYKKRWMQNEDAIEAENKRRQNAREDAKSSWMKYYLDRLLQWRSWTPRFNAIPSKGLWYLYTEGKIRPKNPEQLPEDDLDVLTETDETLRDHKRVLQLNVDDIAEYLIDPAKSEGLNKRQIAHYITDPRVVDMGIHSTVMKRIGFSGISLEEALRKFFVYIRLPNSGKLTAILLRQFAEGYQDANPGSMFSSVDEAYTLTFTILVLDTDLHSDKIKQKMRLNTFVYLAKQSNSMISNEYLEQIYHNIKRSPLSEYIPGGCINNKGGLVQLWDRLIYGFFK